MTSGEKKRLFWVLVMIFFFFANLILGTVMVFRSMSAKPASTAGNPAATSVSTQP